MTRYRVSVDGKLVGTIAVRREARPMIAGPLTYDTVYVAKWGPYTPGVRFGALDEAVESLTGGRGSFSLELIR